MVLIIEAPSNGGRRKLKRTMGLWTATALVVGKMVGSGVFLLRRPSRARPGRSRSSLGS